MPIHPTHSIQQPDGSSDHDRLESTKFAAVFDSESLFIWILSDKGTIQEVNPSAMAVMGAREADMIGQKLWETFGFRDCVTRWTRVKLAIQRAGFGIQDQFRTTLENDSGESVHVDVSVTPVLDRNGEVNYLVARAHDVTELHHASERLRISEERFALATRSSGDGFWDWDLTNDKIWFSPRCREILGFAANDRVNFPDKVSTWIDRLHPDEGESTHAALARSRDQHEILDIKFRMKTKDGQWLWIRSRGDCLRDENGTAIRMTGSHQDINEEKLLEQRLLESNQDLERFAYATSHDLREPLRTVAGYCDLLLEDDSSELSDDGREFAAGARSGALRMHQLISDLMNYSRLSQQELVAICCPSSKIIDNAVAHLTTQVEETGAEIKIVGELPDVLGDPTLLELLFQNLIANAIKFTQIGQVPLIEISGFQSDSRTMICVKDHGIGMDSVDSQKIFDVFHRLHRRGVYEGTGIGLAICKRIADRHHATISVSSERGIGSEFVVSIPHQTETSVTIH